MRKPFEPLTPEHFQHADPNLNVSPRQCAAWANEAIKQDKEYADTLVARLEECRKLLSGCGDSGCPITTLVYGRGGMRTNGGCRCAGSIREFFKKGEMK